MRWLRRCLCIAFILSWMLLLPVSAQVYIGETGRSIFPSRFMPAEGETAVLVVPIEFSDFHFDEDPVDTLSKVFWGAGWGQTSSVSDYFDRASYGKLRIIGEVQPVVTLPDYRDSYRNGYTRLIQEVLSILSQRDVDLTRYDANKDGIMDGLYLVWVGPAQGANSHWWPYSDTFYSDFMAEGMQIGSFSSLSYELLTADSAFRQSTAIHETGHQLGLTDYYATALTSGTYASVMMDRNEGDEDCFSKLLLGWIEPQVVTGSQWLTLSSASIGGDAAVIAAKSWDGNYLSEYLMAEYITPEQNQSAQNCGAAGAIRLWRVNAATSAWTDEITASMYRYQNEGDGPKLLTVLDETQQWYAEGAVISEEQTWLYEAGQTGISIFVDAIQNGQAHLWISYQGEQPPQEESADPIEESEANPDAEESETAEGISQPEQIEREDEQQTEEEASIDMPCEDPVEEPESSGKTTISVGAPILVVVGVGALLLALALSPHKTKHKKRKKRSK